MMLLPHLKLSAAAVALTATATIVKASSFENNLAYNSPSRRHPSLAVPLAHIYKRQTGDLFTPNELSFTHGVASGDPYDTSVILWTRLAPTTENVASDLVPGGIVPIYSDPEAAQPSSKAACVEFQISTSKTFDTVVDSGRAYTTSDVDYTVKFEAANLQPFTVYYYRFNVCDASKVSSVGRLRTLPEKGKKVGRNVKLAVYSCSNYPEGYFNAYGNAVRKDTIDWWIHLGDYIYEYKDSDVRTALPDRETYTLYDYRKRHATYRTDPDLLNIHSAFAGIFTWDDHEVADNSWKNGSLNSEGEVFQKRKQAAVRAYFEWMPIRQVDMDDSLRIWRSFAVGDLFDLFMLDTRQYNRDLTVLNGIAGIGGNSKEVEKLVDLQNRTIMGFNQEEWFYKGLRESKAKWKLVGSQVIFSRMTLGNLLGNQAINRDQWDGYLANRDRVYETLEGGKINNTVFLAGDSHAAWVSDLAWLGKREYDENTGKGAFGVELAGSAVSSASVLTGYVPRFISDGVSGLLIKANPELQWQDLFYRGYFEIEVGYGELKGEFWGVKDLKKRNGEEKLLARFLVRDGENKLARNPSVGGGVAYAGALKGGKVE
ncbi:alkaline phosphatase D [Podospora fimiseda]|uniref:Alkaline phosphatase D n=1 Tax=Podospora fimiseda TaxID=252190 RepID=A0AAN7BRG3_9PEZI|nr:alkaline phosphatase D [Podospora fimiseda]